MIVYNSYGSTDEIEFDDITVHVFIKDYPKDHIFMRAMFTYLKTVAEIDRFIINPNESEYNLAVYIPFNMFGVCQKKINYFIRNIKQNPTLSYLLPNEKVTDSIAMPDKIDIQLNPFVAMNVYQDTGTPTIYIECKVISNK